MELVKLGTDDLKAVSVLSGLDEAGLRELTNVTEGRRYLVAEVVVAADEAPEHIFFILDGEVQVQVPAVGIRTLAAGDFFGEMSLLEGEHFLPPGWRLRGRNATVVAAKSTLVGAVHADNLSLLLRSYPDVRKAIAEIAKQRGAEG